MPKVYRIFQTEKTRVFISDDIWRKIQKKPKIFGRYKWELIPQPKSPIYKDDITKKISPINKNDIAKKASIPNISYDEKDYRKDLKNANLSLKTDNKEKALYHYQRAYKFKKSLYVKTKIKELS